MARPPKKGMDYFPFDVAFFGDIKIKRLKRRFRSSGQSSTAVMAYITIISMIWEKGYYIDVTEDLVWDISEVLECDEKFVRQIIETLVEQEINLFDKSKFDEFGILTSAGIQRRFREIKRISKSACEIDVRFCATEEIVIPEKPPVIPEKPPVIPEKPPVIPEIMPQTKTKTKTKTNTYTHEFSENQNHFDNLSCEIDRVTQSQSREVAEAFRTWVLAVNEEAERPGSEKRPVTSITVAAAFAALHAASPSDFEKLAHLRDATAGRWASLSTNWTRQARASPKQSSGPNQRRTVDPNEYSENF